MQAHVKDLAGLVEFDGVIDARGIRGGKPNAIAMRTCGDVPTSALGPGEGGLLQICFERYLGAGYGWIFPVIEVGG